jgi:hypothetical protein
MGTNFYWSADGLVIARAVVDDLRARRPREDETHLGKRWAAGWYCEDCSCWLADLESCPCCGTPHPPSFIRQAMQGPVQGPVRFACGFSWAQDPEIVGGVCRLYREAKLIVDEYARRVRCEEFLLMLQRYCRRSVMDLMSVAGWC